MRPILIQKLGLIVLILIKQVSIKISRINADGKHFHLYKHSQFFLDLKYGQVQLNKRIRQGGAWIENVFVEYRGKQSDELKYNLRKMKAPLSCDTLKSWKQCKI